MAGGLALGGCGFVEKSPFFSTIATFNKRADGKIDRAKVEAVPYASLLAWFDGSARALLVLGDYLPENRLVWYSAQRQSLTTWGGFVLTLSGVDVSLRSTTLIGQWDRDLHQLVGRPLARTLDYEASSGRATVVTKSQFSDRGIEETQVFDKRRRLRRIREAVVADRWHHYANDYWIDEAGFCWKSRQTVVPTMAPLNLVVTRPALQRQS